MANRAAFTRSQSNAYDEHLTQPWTDALAAANHEDGMDVGFEDGESRVQSENKPDGVAADDEKRLRKLKHGDDFAKFQQVATFHRARSEHLATHRKILIAQRERNRTKMAEHVSELKRLKGENEMMEDVERDLIKDLGPDAKTWERDEKTLEKWEAYFSLEMDVLDLKLGED